MLRHRFCRCLCAADVCWLHAVAMFGIVDVDVGCFLFPPCYLCCSCLSILSSEAVQWSSFVNTLNFVAEPWQNHSQNSWKWCVSNWNCVSAAGGWARGGLRSIQWQMLQLCNLHAIWQSLQPCLVQCSVSCKAGSTNLATHKKTTGTRLL